MQQKDSFFIIATTLHGLEEILAQEIREIGGKQIVPSVRAVRFLGNKELLYKSNLHLRTALKILKPIKSFELTTEETLYNEIKKIDWSEHLDVSDTLAIEATVSSKFFTHSNYVALKVKDAIVDQFREKTKSRPSVDLENPTIKINIHINHIRCDVSINSSGDALFKRGYRTKTNIAPINEVLAAGMVLLSNWTYETPFIDPMCGSGTIITEAALLALNIAPGIFRKQFGFQKWKDYDSDLWNQIIDKAKKQQGNHCPTIMGNDISGKTISIARENIKNAGLEKHIILSTSCINDFIPPPGGGIVITNPPYGERLEPEMDEINELYSMIGTNLKHKYKGYGAWIISNNINAFKNIGLHHSKNITLFNGQLECKFRKYDIYEGSKKEKKKNI